MPFWKVFLVIPIAHILTVFPTQTSAILIIKPRNTVSLKGNRTELNCRRTTDDTSQKQQLMDWDFTPSGTTGPTQIYFNGKFFDNSRSKYKMIRNESGQFDLEFNPIELSHAGNYNCFQRPSQNNEHNSASAELVVLDSDPSCNASVLNETEEYAVNEIQCFVNYNGNAKPKADCCLIKDGANSSNAIWMTSTRTPNSHKNISRDIMTTTFNISKPQNITFVCKIKFISTSDDVLDDKFEYLYTWTHLFRPMGKISTSDNTESSLPFAMFGILIGLSVLLCVLTILLCLLCISQRKGASNHRVEPDILAVPSQVDANLHYEEIDIKDQPRHFHIMAEESRHEDFLPSRKQCVPVYAVVKKEPNAYGSRNATKIPNVQLYEDALWTKEPRTSKTTTGADGTVYMEISSHSDHRQPSAVNRRPLFSKVETYALIDHKSRCPPPPPPSF